MWRIKLDQAEQLLDSDPANKELQNRYNKISQPDFVDSIVSEYTNFTNQVNIMPDCHKEALKNQTIIFEGAQGILLDVNYGFWPHVTKTDITYKNAEDLIAKTNPNTTKNKIGILRAYLTRHGAGPFVTENTDLTNTIPDVHNQTNTWQDNLRVGYFDLVAAKYSLEVIGNLNSIALTNIDRLTNKNNVKVCTNYEYAGNENIDDYFNYQIIDDKKIINKIKVTKQSDRYHQSKLADLLNQCTPVYKSFEPWTNNTPEDQNLKTYLDYLESEKALNTKISILSFGPESKDKVVYRQELV